MVPRFSSFSQEETLSEDMACKHCSIKAESVNVEVCNNSETRVKNGQTRSIKVGVGILWCGFF